MDISAAEKVLKQMVSDAVNIAELVGPATQDAADLNEIKKRATAILERIEKVRI